MGALHTSLSGAYTGLAAEQWRSARQSMQDFKRLRKRLEKDSDAGEKANATYLESVADDKMVSVVKQERTIWTTTHGFFADMGGVQVLFTDSDPFPVTAYQLHWLVKNGFLEYPAVDKKTILDKDKADIFARIVTLVQVLWFSVQCAARGVQHLRLTTLELSTVAFAWCAMHTSFFWRSKPLDVDDPIILPSSSSLQSILDYCDQHPGEEAWYTGTPLDFLSPPPAFSYVEPFWVSLTWMFNLEPKKRSTPITCFNNTSTIPPRGLLITDIGFAIVFIPSYYAIHLAAWTFAFPTEIEVLLWRISTIIQASTITLFMFTCWPGCYMLRFFMGADRQYGVQQAQKLPRWAQLIFIIPVSVSYFVSRVYIIVEGFNSLRRQPAVVFQCINWWAFLPHL